MWHLLFLVSTVLADCPSGAVYDSNFNKCYQYISEPTAFYLAEQQCVASGANLASITNGFENAMIAEDANKNFGRKNFWIGANTLLSSNWTWVSGAAFNYSNWDLGQPNATSGQCAMVNYANGAWDVAPCANAAPFVCVSPSITTTQPPVVTCPTQRPIPAHCESTWTYFKDTNSCYKVGHQKQFNDAEQDCVDNGAHLVSLHSQAESEFVNIFASSSVKYKDSSAQTWIGLHKKGDTWVYTDGSKVNFINWQPKQPDNAHGEESCVQTFSDYSEKHGEEDYHKWNDIKCDETMRAYVCKKAPLQ